MGLVVTAVIEGLGPSLFRAMGGSDEAVRHATLYARVVFAGAVLVWLANTLAAVLRGAGNMRLPARIMLGAWAFDAVLPILLLTRTGLGIAGAAIAHVATFLIACIAMIAALRAGGAGFTPSLRTRPDPALFARILSVGLIASVMAAIANLTTVLVTALVGMRVGAGDWAGDRFGLAGLFGAVAAALVAYALVAALSVRPSVWRARSSGTSRSSGPTRSQGRAPERHCREQMSPIRWNLWGSIGSGVAPGTRGTSTTLGIASGVSLQANAVS